MHVSGAGSASALSSVNVSSALSPQKGASREAAETVQGPQDGDGDSDDRAQAAQATGKGTAIDVTA